MVQQIILYYLFHLIIIALVSLFFFAFLGT